MVNKTEVGFCFHAAHVLVRATKKKSTQTKQVVIRSLKETSKAAVENESEEHLLYDPKKSLGE